MCFDQDTIKLLTETRPGALTKTLPRLLPRHYRGCDQNPTTELAKTLSRYFDQDTIKLLTETRQGALIKTIPRHLPRHYQGALTKTLLSY